MKICCIIFAIVSFFLGVLVAGWRMSKIVERIDRENRKTINKFQSYYILLGQWLSWELQNKSLSGWFVKHNIHKIAIYGMGEIGSRLYEGLKGTEIEVAYVIDKNISWSFNNLPVLTLEDDIPKVDAIVVTPIFAFCSIERDIKSKSDIRIISLNEIFDL